ncbi:hypothetical protein ABIA33_006959 [Streptacidiphilus sp. MAP12-16]|uniref:hypothetical protein n=1 Tax=Streptacidiphilus sp. MAP12-16 TaxID=3156300 RepID=UPI0035188FB6
MPIEPSDRRHRRSARRVRLGLATSKEEAGRGGRPVAGATSEIDADWNPVWPLAWQRHDAGVRECVQELRAELGVTAA